MSAGADFSQLRSFSATLASAGPRAERLAPLVVQKTAVDIEGLAKVLCPVDTGFLKSSIGHEVNGLSAEIGPTAEYGIYVELGTARAAAQPFLGPATDKYEPVFQEAMAKLGEDALND